MNLSFSTIGWQNLSWQDYVHLAQDMDINGIEITNPSQLSNIGDAFHTHKARSTARELRMQDLSVPNIYSMIDISCASSVDENIQNLKEIIDISAMLSCPCVSVYAKSDDEESVRSVLNVVLPYAIKNNVCILVETCGIYADTNRLCLLLDSFASDFLAALWNIYEPYFVAQERPAVTIRNLGAYVRHVHIYDAYDVKDAAAGGAGSVGSVGATSISQNAARKDADGNIILPAHALVGEGNMPIDEFVRALASINYPGFISFVWDTNWVPGLHDPEVVLPYFENYMARFQDTSSAKNPLILNHDGTGQYVW